MTTSVPVNRRIAFVLLFSGALGALSSTAAAGTSGGKNELPLPREGYACCNLHYEGDWISDGNYSGLPMLPAGTPIKVLSLGRHKAYALVGGIKMRLGHDYGRDQESLEHWITKIVVDEDPTARIAKYPPDVQAAIKEGRVAIGMTKEQAIVAVGYPLTSETSSTDAPVWRHWVSSFEEYQLMWGPDATLAGVSADAALRYQVVHQPPGDAAPPPVQH